MSSDVVSSRPTFEAFGLGRDLLRALDDCGYTHPSPIQAETLPHLLQGSDLLGQAQTGTGKTAAFALPALERLDLLRREPQVLVLVPTRELAIQVAEAIARYATHLAGVDSLAIYGGADFRAQVNRLRRGPQIIVGTPGRLMDHIRQGNLSLDKLGTVVLDEADEMLRMGFIDDVEWILGQSPAQRQVVLFSATMPAEIRRLSRQYLRDPAEVTIAVRKADTRRIHQRLLQLHASQKLEALHRVLEAEASEATLVFARTKIVTAELDEALEARGHRCAALNGDVAQAQRERIIERLRNGQIDVVVATDVAARGLDVERISLVVNYDVPLDPEAYIHRIGRTGRAGRKGDAILFVTPRERRLLMAIQRLTGQQLEPMALPGPEAVNSKRELRLMERIRQQLGGHDVALFERILVEFCKAESITPIRAAAALAQLLQGERPFLLSLDDQLSMPQAHGGRDALLRRGGREGGRSERRERRPDRREQSLAADMDRYRIEVGWKHRVKPGNIVGAIANEAGLQGKAIGRIDIFAEHSTVDLPKGMPGDVFAALQQLTVVDQPLRIRKLQSRHETTAA